MDLAREPWQPVSVRLDGTTATLLIKFAAGDCEEHAYTCCGVFAPGSSNALFESLSVSELTSRTATVAPAFRRNPPRKVVRLVHHLLLAKEMENVSCDARWTTPSTLNLSLKGQIGGLVFAWKMTLIPPPPSVDTDTLIPSQFLTPMIASINVLLTNQIRLEKIIADKEKEIEELRAALVNNANHMGGIVRVKKTTPHFNSTQIFQESLQQVFPPSLIAGDIEAASHAVSLSLFQKPEMESVYKSVMTNLIPTTDEAERRREPGDDEDLSQLDYVPDGPGSTQVIGGGSGGGSSSTQIPAGTQGVSATQKSKKEEADETVDRRLKELMELAEKKQQAAAKPKKRKII
ncbi:hypothetical protein HDU99_002888 [Rhizoclosmatium hyalinum]|nr:hypothetical protein HDU99_002888 [Rhizoclosmatium hyalinum]